MEDKTEITEITIKTQDVEFTIKESAEHVDDLAEMFYKCGIALGFHIKSMDSVINCQSNDWNQYKGEEE